jgi:hypothetical protein
MTAERMTEEWSTAPKDGSVINVQFAAAVTSKVRWNATEGRWEVLRANGTWVGMQYAHGLRDPVGWRHDRPPAAPSATGSTTTHTADPERPEMRSVGPEDEDRAGPEVPTD